MLVCRRLLRHAIRDFEPPCPKAHLEHLLIFRLESFIVIWTTVMQLSSDPIDVEGDLECSTVRI